MMKAARPSAEALAFLAAERPRLPSLTPDTAWAFREAIRTDTLRRAQRALDRHSVRVEESRIADIPCLVVTPDNWAGGPDALYCFGGGFFSGSPREDLILTAPLATYSGRRIVMIDYRLAPEHPHPAAIDDGFAVYREVAAKSAFSLIGESAGGNLALVLRGISPYQPRRDDRLAPAEHRPQVCRPDPPPQEPAKFGQESQ